MKARTGAGGIWCGQRWGESGAGGGGESYEKLTSGGSGVFELLVPQGALGLVEVLLGPQAGARWKAPGHPFLHSIF